MKINTKKPRENFYAVKLCSKSNPSGNKGWTYTILDEKIVPNVYGTKKQALEAARKFNSNSINDAHMYNVGIMSQKNFLSRIKDIPKNW